MRGARRGGGWRYQPCTLCRVIIRPKPPALLGMTDGTHQIDTNYATEPSRWKWDTLGGKKVIRGRKWYCEPFSGGGARGGSHICMHIERRACMAWRLWIAIGRSSQTYLFNNTSRYFPLGVVLKKKARKISQRLVYSLNILLL